MSKPKVKTSTKNKMMCIDTAFRRHKSNDSYQYHELRTWKELTDFYDKVFPKRETSRWLFRGDVFVWKKVSERSMKDAFRTSLDKAFKEFNRRDNIQKASRGQETKRNKIEKRILRSFRRRAHLLAGDKDGTQNHLETFALLRHYGGPARILDWMYSFFPAVYLAINRYDKSNTYTVWVLNNKWLKEVSGSTEADLLMDADYLLYHFKYMKKKRKQTKEETELRRRRYSEIRTKLEYYDRYDNNRFQSLVITYLMNKNSKSLIYAANPYRLNERLAAQRGVLLFSGTVEKTGGENLRDVITDPPKNKYGKEIRVKGPILWEISLRLTKNRRNEFLRRLDEMNINQATLFPDLDGFAQSLRTRIAHPESLGIVD